jgi:uncharacterized protein YfkK (UPF0435 family)
MEDLVSKESVEKINKHISEINTKLGDVKIKASERLEEANYKDSADMIEVLKKADKIIAIISEMRVAASKLKAGN